MVIDLSAYISYKMKGCAGFKIKMACLFQDNLYMSLPQRSLMIWGVRYKREFSPLGNFDYLEVELWVSGTALKLGSHMGKNYISNVPLGIYFHGDVFCCF